MSALPQPETWTVEQYLAYERHSDVHHEYLNGEIIAFAGASERHNQLTVALTHSLYGQLMERPCQVFQGDMRVKVAENAYFYPDVIVICGEVRYTSNTRNTLLNPTVIIEVLSPSTQDFDRGSKFLHYRLIPSLTDYVLVSQDQMHIEHYTRQGETWVLRDFRQPEETIKLASIECTLNLQDVYRKVSFDE